MSRAGTEVSYLPLRIQEFLNCVPTLASLELTALEALARAAVVRRYRAREILFRAGDPPIDLIILLDGRVVVERASVQRSHLLHIESRGGVLGEIPVFGKDLYPATATALEPSRCAHVPVAVIERLLTTEPSFGRFALNRLAIRAASLLHRIDELTASTVIARLANLILVRARDARGGDFTLGRTQNDLAQELGTAREVVVRGIATLITTGALRRTGRSRFAIVDASVLRAVASAQT